MGKKKQLPSEKARFTRWLPNKNMKWLERERDRVNGLGDSDLRCRIVTKGFFSALFYNRIYFFMGHRHNLPMIERVETE